jgi:hypothetical protein
MKPLAARIARMLRAVAGADVSMDDVNAFLEDYEKAIALADSYNRIDVTQNLREENRCPHAWGKWYEKTRTSWMGQFSVVQERRCTLCVLIELKRVSV